MSTEHVLIDRPRPQVALVTLNRPERMNSMAFDVMLPLKRALDELTHDNSVRAVVLTGAGQGFSSGADHKLAGSIPHVDGLTRPTFGLRSMQVLDDVILGLRKMHQPVIAAVNGAAIGGGLCLALACDIRVAGEAAYFRAAGINNGLTASELGLSYLLPRAIGTSRSFEMMLTASYVLLTLGATREQVRSGMTYVVISLLSSTLFVTAIALVYSATGTLRRPSASGWCRVRCRTPTSWTPATRWPSASRGSRGRGSS